MNKTYLVIVVALSMCSFMYEAILALAGVSQWIEHQPANQMVASSIPNQDTCLGCEQGPRLGAHNRQPHIDVFLLRFLPSCPSLKMNK